jgi:hypothetical protein
VDEISESVRDGVVAPAHREVRGRQPKRQHDAEAAFLNCSRCGLSIRVWFASLEIQHCPRCLARARLLQPLFRSPLPLTTLCGDERAPELESQVDVSRNSSSEPPSQRSPTLARSSGRDRFVHGGGG